MALILLKYTKTKNKKKHPSREGMGNTTAVTESYVSQDSVYHLFLINDFGRNRTYDESHWADRGLIVERRCWVAPLGQITKCSCK